MRQVNPLFEHLYMCRFKTDIGWMRPISDGNSLIRLDWNQTGWDEPDRPDYVSRETKSQIQAFFKGQLHQFNLSLAPVGKTSTGRHWLNVMAKIPYGTVMTYSEYAQFADKPNAARAAGSVCANNPIPIIYPCHRVVRADRTLGNYGGGSNKHSAHPENVNRKAALLMFETKHKRSRLRI